MRAHNLSVKLFIFVLFFLLAFTSDAQVFQEIIEKAGTKNFREIVKKVEDYYRDKDKGKGTGYKQFKRWEYFHRTRLDTDGNIVNISKVDFIELNRYAAGRNSNARMSGGTAGNWKSIGPITHDRSNQNGRINCVVVDPANKKIIYAGSPSGGLWRSKDEGATWQCLTESISNYIGISSIVIDPASPATNRTIYILTGDKDGSNTSFFGIFRSRDNGGSWQEVPYSYPTIGNVYKLILHPANSKMLFMINDQGIFVRQDEGEWQKKLTADVNDIEFNPSNTAVMYATGASGTFRSSNTGATWQKVTSSIPVSRRNELAVSPANPALVYLLVGQYGVGSLYKSTNHGVSYTKVPTAFDFKHMTGGQYLYDLALAVSPVDAKKVFIGGITMHRSGDGGVTWVDDNMGHVDYHSLDFYHGYLYAGNDGGIVRRNMTIAGQPVEDLSTGFSVTQIYKLAHNPTDANHVLIGSQDNGTSSVRNARGTLFHGGDGMECFIDPVNPQVWYSSYQHGTILRSDNGGMWYSNITPPVSGGLWLTPMVMDPLDHNTIYAGYQDLWKLTAPDGQWQNLTNGATGGDYIETMAVAPSNPNYIYLYKWNTDNVIHRSTNGGATWSKVTFPVNTSVTSITVHPANPNTLWITSGLYHYSGQVYKSVDGGKTWKDVSGSLPNVPASCAVYQKGSANGIYVGTDLGVFYKDDTMTDWISFDAGMPYAIVTDLEINDRAKKIYASTYGRGAWISDLHGAVTTEVQCAGTGKIKREVWTGIPGKLIASIPVNSPPSSVSELSLFEAPSNTGDQYGSRVRGFICPPATGEYTFWVSGDDSSELWLSTDDNPDNKVRIAYATAYTNKRQWDKYTTQKSERIRLVAGQKYYIESLHKESLSGDHLAVGWQLPNTTLERPIPGNRLMSFQSSSTDACAGAGGISTEVWKNIPGKNISEIPVSAPPSSSGTLAAFESPANIDDNYGRRIRGFVCVPATGNYTFWISGDDNSELWLSTDENPVNARKIAYSSAYTGLRQWNKYPSQQSSVIKLYGGKKYYIEALLKESTGNDHVAVGWQLPGGVLERPIPGNRLLPSGNNISSAPRPNEGDTLLAASEGEHEITLSPNPAREGVITLTLPGSAEENSDEGVLQVINMNGEIVFARDIRCQADCNTIQFDLTTTMHPGVYLVHAIFNRKRFSKRLIVY
jgi:photosystem II stability/assembly factor-like uncharacterized protein